MRSVGVIALRSVALLALALSGCDDGGGDAPRDAQGGDGGQGGMGGDGGLAPDAALSDVAEWTALPAPADMRLTALAGTGDGVYLLGRPAQGGAQLLAFDGRALVTVGPAAADGFDHLAGRTGDALFAVSRFASGRGASLLFRFDGGRWVDEQLGPVALTQASAVEALAVGADGLVWMASAGGLLRVEGRQFQAFSYQEDRFEFAETFVSVATPPEGGRPLAASERGTYRINLDGSATAWPLLASRVALTSETEGFAVTTDPPGFAWLSGEAWTPQAVEALTPAGARISMSPAGTAWVLEQLPEGGAPNRLWQVSTEAATPFALPPGAPRFTDVLARTDDDVWLTGEDGVVWRWVAPADAANGRVDLPEPPAPPTIEVLPVPPGLSGRSEMVALADGRLWANVGNRVQLFDGEGWTAAAEGLAPSQTVHAAGDEVIGQDDNQRVIWWRPAGSVRSDTNVGRYTKNGAALAAPGEPWAILSQEVGRLTGDPLEWVAEPGAPVLGRGFSAPTITGGDGEVWVHANGTLYGRVGGVWQTYALGQLSAISALAWTGPGHVIAGGQNGSVFEVRAGEVRPHAGLTNNDINAVFGVGDRLFVRAQDAMFGFDGVRWEPVRFDDHPNVIWYSVRGVRPQVLHYLGTDAANAPVLLRVTRAD